MPNPLGFSTGFYYGLDWPLEKRLASLLEVSNAAVELQTTDLFALGESLSEAAIALMREFQYRSVHLPATIQYPSPEADLLLPHILKLIDDVAAHAIVIHPDTITDPAWVAKNFDDRIAIENMDINKTFGQIPDDLLQLFEKIPQAKWVFDINHAYTVDPTQTLGGSLFHNLSYRLTHYHFSGYGNDHQRHIPLSETHQDEMFRMLSDKNVPIIIESVAQDDSADPVKEYQYILDHLGN